MTRVDPLGAALFLLVAFTLAGVAQTAWLASRHSQAFALPLDGRLRLRGRRLFGANKTVRGFVVMVPAAAVAFALLAALAADAVQAFLWPLSLSSYALVGAWAGFGFMVGELPNSFLKRQLDIAPGEAPRRPWPRVAHFLLDRIDSPLGALAALSVVIQVPWLTWIYLLLVGPAIHWLFSVAMFQLGLKRRAA